MFKISRRMCEVTSQHYATNREWFIQFHGPEVLVKILKHPPLVKHPQLRNHRGAAFLSSNNTYDHQVMRTQCMAILRELCYTPNYQIAEWLAADDSLLVFLFSLLAHTGTFYAAIGLIEEILAAKDETFNLASVPNFGSLVRGLSKGQLALFCRILSMVIFEPDDKGGDEVGMLLVARSHALTYKCSVIFRVVECTQAGSLKTKR